MNVGLLTAWRFWDSIYYQVTRLQYVDKAEGNIFRIVLLRYKGKPIQTGDGTWICPGDYYAKLHIHNYRLAYMMRGVSNENRRVLIVLREIRKSLPRLAQYLHEHPKASEIKGVIGTTMLYRGSEQLGFRVADMDGNYYPRYKTWYLRWMLWILHPCGLARLQKKPEQLIAKRVYMSKDELMEKYLSLN